MIGRKAHPKHPDDPTRCVFVPLTYDRHSGECVPIMGPEGSQASELTAARVCLGDWLTRYWAEIRRMARQVRAFCEHPDFVSFTADGIDAEMIRTSAQQMAEIVELGSHNIIRLFDPPTDDDQIRMGDMVYELDAETRLLIPARVIESEAETLSPDTLLARYVRLAVQKVSDLLQRPISRRGIEQAIDHLILTLPADDDEDESTEREAPQFIADHRSVRYLLTAIERAEKRTGRRVGVRGMEAMIAVLKRLIATHEGEDDNEASAEVTSEYPRPVLDGVVLREINDESPGDDQDTGNGLGDGEAGGKDQREQGQPRSDARAEKPDTSDGRGDAAKGRNGQSETRPTGRKTPVKGPGNGKPGSRGGGKGGNNGTS